MTNEFHPDKPPLLSLAQNIGLLVGAMFWGFGCDIFGRKWAFNLTILITSVFGLIAASSPNFAAIGIYDCFWSIGVGGNLPVDSAIFLEFLPGNHQYLLVVLSIFWAFAQLLATLIAWPLLGNLTCQETDTDCTRAENFGWRYFMIATGGFAMIMFIIRFIFTLYESPKYLMGKGEILKFSSLNQATAPIALERRMIRFGRVRLLLRVFTYRLASISLQP